MTDTTGEKSRRKPARFRLALAAAKLSTVALRVARRGGTNFPGEVANKLCPDFLAGIEPPERSIYVTGSTGKTTTTNLVCDLLVAMGQDPVSNRAGSNINTGIETALLKASDMGGRSRKRIAAIEIDERWTTSVLPHVDPSVIVVTNLGRDSFHRNSNVHVVFDVLDKSLDCGARLVLNGDDLITAHLAEHNRNRVYFGIARLPGDPDKPESIVNDMEYCPCCGTRLDYEFSRYNHIGRARCPKCGFGSPELDYEMRSVDLDARTCEVYERAGGTTHEYPIMGWDITDLYNELAAIAGLREMGFSPAQLQAALRGRRPTTSRYDEQALPGGKKLYTVLTKGQNPVGCSRSFDRIRRLPGPKAVIVMLDDARYLTTSSEYTGWYYECDFEYLADPSISQVILHGVREQDLKLRLLLAGVRPDRIVLAPSPEAAADAVDLERVQGVCVSFDNYNGELCDRCTARLRERLGGTR